MWLSNIERWLLKLTYQSSRMVECNWILIFYRANVNVPVFKEVLYVQCCKNTMEDKYSMPKKMHAWKFMENSQESKEDCSKHQWIFDQAMKSQYTAWSVLLLSFNLQFSWALSFFFSFKPKEVHWHFVAEIWLTEKTKCIYIYLIQALQSDA